MVVTLDLLDRFDACLEQRLLFEQHYPQGVEITVENLLEARKHGLEVFWLMGILPTPAQEALHKLRDARPRNIGHDAWARGLCEDLCTIYATMTMAQLELGNWAEDDEP